MRRVAAVALLCALLAACARGPDAVSASGGSGRGAGAQPTGAATSSSPRSAASASGTPVAQARPTVTFTPGTTEANPASHFPIEFDLPACLERGRAVAATITTAASSIIIASAAYSDGANHGGVWSGSTDTGGRFPIAITPPPGAPLGPAKIIVGVNGNEGGATAQRHFVLAAPGGCA